MANKIKNHPPEVLAIIKEISTALHAKFISSKISMAKLSKETGLSANSIKTIFKGDTANIASFLAVAKTLGLSLGLMDLTAKTEDGSPSGKFL